jgi:hypothetical protein
MWIRTLAGRSSAALILAALASFPTFARAQNPAIDAKQLESEVAAARSENGVIREQLRRLESSKRRCCS